jgi:two-component system, LytTR family, response regulator
MGTVANLIAPELDAPVRVLIVDDEPTARHRMIRLLGGMPLVSIVGTCGSGRDAIDAIQRHAPELVFLDIAMPGIDGLGVARRFAGEQGPVVVFVTAYDEHALEAFRVHATDYVLKPIDHTKLREALEHARVSVRRMRAERAAAPAQEGAASLPVQVGRFAVRDGHRTHLVPIADLLWIESFGNYARVYTSGRRYIHRATMASITEKLVPHGFARIHRTVIVNMDRIAEIHPRGSGQHEVVLDTGAKLRVSRTFRAALEQMRRRTQ